MDFSGFLREEEEIDLLDEGLWDVGAGLARALGGAVNAGDELLARTVGQGSKGRLSRSFGDIGGGLHRATFGKPAPLPAPSAAPVDFKAVRDEFDRLKAAYGKAHRMGDMDLKRRIRARMIRVDPAAYAELVNKSMEARRETERKRWAFASSAAKPERPEGYLARLAAEG